MITVDPPGTVISVPEEDRALAFKLAEKMHASLIDVFVTTPTPSASAACRAMAATACSGLLALCRHARLQDLSGSLAFDLRGFGFVLLGGCDKRLTGTKILARCQTAAFFRLGS
jgi:hypothetical protein